MSKLQSVLDRKLESEIKNIEVNYRGIFQKIFARRICRAIVYAARRQGKVGFSYGRYSDAPERNGVPCKYFAVVGAMSKEDFETKDGSQS